MGKLADAMRVRATRVKPETARIRGDVGKILVEGLREGTDAELYERTPLPVTHKMRRAIQLRFRGANAISVGFDDGVAPHAAIRLAKTGRSKMGGHNMTLRPAQFILRQKGAEIRKRGFDGLQNILGEGVTS